MRSDIATVDYGVDAPPVLRNLLLGGAAAVGAGAALRSWTSGRIGSSLGLAFFAQGGMLLASAGLMALYVKRGKFRHRERILDLYPWKGDETVLDIGTGRGLLMIGAAKRLKTGKAVGIDIWNAEDLSNNSQDATLQNAALEGVSDRVEVRSEDARRMSFRDGTFDVIVSNLCIHNIPSAEGRTEACREIARVLKPGGTAIISDFRFTEDYARTFEASGLQVERLGASWLDTFPPLWILRAGKPA